MQCKVKLAYDCRQTMMNLPRAAFWATMIALLLPGPRLKANLDLAADLAARYGAKLWLVTVVQSREIPDGLRQWARTEHVLDAPEWVLENAVAENVLVGAEDRARERGATALETLVEKGHTYESSGHVLFAVQSMPDYGKLSHRSLEDMLAGARVEVADYKHYPGDFVLWKPSAPD